LVSRVFEVLPLRWVRPEIALFSEARNELERFFPLRLVELERLESFVELERCVELERFVELESFVELERFREVWHVFNALFDKLAGLEPNRLFFKEVLKFSESKFKFCKFGLLE
jgi:hypothetical protein